jgi:hypothetical protein
MVEMEGQSGQAVLESNSSGISILDKLGILLASLWSLAFGWTPISLFRVFRFASLPKFLPACYNKQYLLK